jgi:DNA-binding transcriptional LysR family regulator
VSSRLPELLRDFVRRHTLVDLQLTVGVSATLHEQLDAGELDLILAKRRAGDESGQLVWRDRLVWIGAPDTRVDAALPVPLILFAPPSITRSVALEALERVARPWRIVCTSGSLSGVRAAALAGLGITLHAQGLIPDGMVEVPAAARLPAAGEVAFVVQTGRQGERGPVAELAQAILTNGDRLQR